MNNPAKSEETVRLSKLAEIRRQGIDPYPQLAVSATSIRDLRDKYAELIKLKSEGGLRTKEAVVGRLLGWREHGKIVFADLADSTGQIQLFFQMDKLGPAVFERLKLFDISDLVVVQGSPFVTKAGEFTLKISEIALLAKALAPLPAEHFGLKDTELRYRKRYLDFNLNPASRKTVEIRSKLLTAFRQIMDQAGFLEVETPMLQPIPGGAAAKPFKTRHQALDCDFYLRIAPELYLKRLVIGGFDRVYEIGRAFRNEGISHQHNPEFTIFEFYWAYQDRAGLIKFTEQMISKSVRTITGKSYLEYQGKKIDLKPPYKVWKLADIIKQKTGIDINRHRTIEKLWGEVLHAKVEVQRVRQWPALVDEIFKKAVRPRIIQPTFIVDHPIELSPLAKKKTGSDDIADRFQLVIAGLEVVNAYAELNDPIDQQKRFEEQGKLLKAGWEEGQRYDKDFIEALKYGLPPTAGWGMGVDRFVMLLTNQDSIKEVIAFPTLRPEKNQTEK